MKAHAHYAVMDCLDLASVILFEFRQSGIGQTQCQIFQEQLSDKH